MKRVLAVLLVATACVAGSTPGFARGGGGHGGFGHMGFSRNPTTLLGSSAATMPNLQSRIPAPLAAPAQAPTINGPSARSPYGGVL
jgi:hypothetical protein